MLVDLRCGAVRCGSIGSSCAKKEGEKKNILKFARILTRSLQCG